MHLELRFARFLLNLWCCKCNVFNRLVCYAVSGSDDSIPTPVVLIDQDSDANATVVEVSFGDRLGALLDTVCNLFGSYCK